MDYRKYVRWSVTSLSLFVVVSMIAVMAYASSFSIFGADDFSTSSVGFKQIRTVPEIVDHLHASVKRVIIVYNVTQGTWFSVLIHSLFHPLYEFGIGQLRIFMALLTVTFCASIILWCVAILSEYDGKFSVKIIVTTIVLFLLIGYQSFPEVFTWYTGASVYGWPTTILVLSLVCFWQSQSELGRSRLICAIVLGFFACGGVIANAGLLCYMLLVGTAYSYVNWPDLETKTRNLKRNLTAFTFCLVGAIVNVVAPGNYVRHKRCDASGLLHPITAIWDSIRIVKNEAQFYFSDTFFVSSLLFVVLCIVYLERVEIRVLRSNNVLLKLGLGLLALFAPFVVVFPIVLGYGGTRYFPNRCRFVVLLAFILSFLFFAKVLGQFLVAVVHRNQILFLILGLTIALSACFYQGTVKARKMALCKVVKCMRKGMYKSRYNQFNILANRLKHCEPGSDILIPREELPIQIDVAYNFFLSEDPKHWINGSIARYYKLNSIMVQDNKTVEF